MENGHSSGIGVLEDIEDNCRIVHMTVAAILSLILSGAKAFLEDQTKGSDVLPGESGLLASLMISTVAAACLKSTLLAGKPSLLIVNKG